LSRCARDGERADGWRGRPGARSNRLDKAKRVVAPIRVGLKEPHTRLVRWLRGLLGRRLRRLLDNSRVVWTLALLASILWALYVLRPLAEGQRWLTPTLAIIGVLVVLVLVVYLLPPRLIPSNAQLEEADRLKAVGDVRSALVQALGGAALVGTLYFTAVSLQDSRTSTNRTLELTRQGQIADRFTRAVAQLGDAALDVRVGGIYALEQVARDATEDRTPILEILTSYLREHDRWQPSATTPSSQPETTSGPAEPELRADFQAVVTVLGRRVQDPSSPDFMHLRGVDLRGGDLYDAHLDRADLRDAHLEKANLGYAHLKLADLRDAHLDRANLGYAHLEGVFLTSAHLEAARLKGADLSGAHLDGGADLRGAHLEGAILLGAHLEGADLTGVVGMTEAQRSSTVGTPAKQ